MGRRPGRPRATGDPHEQRDTRQDVLDAAAALFCTVGYAATSTRAVADRAGVRQASIYHHFASKDAILLDLLLGSVRPSLELADRLATTDDAPAAARLWALAHADVLLLTTSPVNVGALYLLPEVDGEQFAEFHALRDRLRTRYDDLAAQVLAALAAAGEAPATDDVVAVEAAGPLVLGLVESVILRRRAGERLDDDAVARSVADGVLRLLGGDATTVEAARTASADLASAATGATARASGVREVTERVPVTMSGRAPLPASDRAPLAAPGRAPVSAPDDGRGAPSVDVAPA
ncbi:TetR/AcrR family transcriptional regulator [Cellulomonas fimi]|uniref:TetR/AcrR family transcriptional regulator n=1 Tax=Cellulomonas fimi TaxID=1708 RepID=UPI00234D777F|nr:TetR/AcrR family transcriptional regulator [Cellulomonas fimi]MDC7121949.1 TetR/AcrR family transcriptional regulator [Cellulomonas fimi]